MKIISHRGYWKTSEEKNTFNAFERSFSLSFGTETDLRDYNSQIIISHDIAKSKDLSLISLLEIYNIYNKNIQLALNIKADGLQILLKELLLEYEIYEYFVFDMSVPDTLGYINHKINFFSRQSEYELNPIFYDKCKGIWLDAFNGDWYGYSLILDHIKKGKQVAIVSPELHKRDQLPLWEHLRKKKIHLEDEVTLCTDFPEEAQKFFT